MSDGKHCPACGKDIGIWPVLTAGLPNWLRCPHCKARLSYGNSGAVVICLFVLLLVLSAAVFYVIRQRYAANGVQFHLLLAGLVLAAWLPVEFGATLYLRNRGTLQKVA